MFYKSKLVVLSLFLLALAAAACASPGGSSLPETQPAATDRPAAATEVPAATEISPTETAAGSGEGDSDLRPLVVDAVQVEVGVGSPIPVEVVASGTWPELCAQVARVEQRLAGTGFEIEIYASPAAEDCPPDQVGLPFRIAVPLNMVELPAGTYSVSVNGVETGFAWDFSPASGGVPAEAEPGELIPLSVIAASVDVGVGSPIPVEVVASGDWPSLCSQLALVEQQVSGNRVEINLLATPGSADCPPDHVGIPFRVAVPLNMVELPLGAYTVVVNGLETQFEWTGASPATPTADEDTETGVTVAYIGADGNLWLIENGGEPRQITTDGTPPISDQPAPMVSYYFPNISEDGRFIAVRRDAGTPVDYGMQYEYGLWVHDTASGEATQVYDKNSAGFDWKPGTHLLAFGAGVEEGYFTNNSGQPDASLATGIMAYDLDSGVTMELVKPERGFALYSPVWSPDGRYLGFDELMYYEGRGPFAYYDFEAQQYVPWEDPIGSYDWSPDSSQLAYDRLTYTASGEERIFIKPLTGGEEQQFSPDFPGGYAFLPVFSPEGERIAYMAALGGPDDFRYNLYVQDLAGGEPRDLGQYESVWNLHWTADGEHLVFHAGPYGSQQVVQVSAADGASTVLAPGNSPTVAAP